MVRTEFYQYSFFTSLNRVYNPDLWCEIADCVDLTLLGLYKLRSLDHYFIRLPPFAAHERQIFAQALAIGHLDDRFEHQFLLQNA